MYKFKMMKDKAKTVLRLFCSITIIISSIVLLIAFLSSSSKQENLALWASVSINSSCICLLNLKENENEEKEDYKDNTKDN